MRTAGKTDIPAAVWENCFREPQRIREVPARQTAICGLGYVAPNPLNTAIAFFPKSGK